MNDLITITEMNTSPALRFKDERLTEATSRIVQIYQDAAVYAEQKNREIAKILDQIATGQLYAKDGFKSVADYANQVFNLSRGNAYALSAAGRVYNDDSAPEALKAITPHKLAAVSSVDRAVVEKAVTDGTLTADSTEKAFKEFAQEHKPASNDKPQLIKDYRMKFIGMSVSSIDTSAHKPIEEWLAELKTIAGFNGTPDIVKLPNGYTTLPNGQKAPKATLMRRLLISDSFALVVEFSEYHAQVTKRKTKVKGPQFTREELLAMLAAMPPVEGEDD